MSGILGGDALGGVGVGDWPYTLGAGLYSGGVVGCWLCTLGDVACWFLRSVESSVILVGDGFGLEGGLRKVLGLSCAKMSANLAKATLVSVPKTANGVSGARLRKRCRRSCTDS